MSDDVADAREALANLRAARETCCRAVTYSALRAAAISLETAALDAEEAFAALLDRLDAVAPLAAAAEHYRAAVAAEVEAKLRFDAERDGRGDHDAIDEARWRWSTPHTQLSLRKLSLPRSPGTTTHAQLSLRVSLRSPGVSDENLRGANLEGADLRGADLRGVDLEGANLCRVNLTDCSRLPNDAPITGWIARDGLLAEAA